MSLQIALSIIGESSHFPASILLPKVFPLVYATLRIRSDKRMPYWNDVTSREIRQ